MFVFGLTTNLTLKNTDGIAVVDIGAFADDPPHDPWEPISPPSVPS
jgi:hypothetical protein